MTQKLIIVPHTHWDREWFDTFEIFRLHLVEFMDALVQKLETEEKIPCFLLDGQMALIEDYLEMRPEVRERLTRLARQGRITLGPWYIQPDEFLVSGESLIRNLKIGLAQAKAMGQPLMEGYVPDTFGHIMQLPQILRGFGISTFYTMRGLGADIESLGTEFSWRSPDGSAVAAHYIAESYSNAGIIGPTPEETAISHGKTVTYKRLEELIGRMSKHSRIPALLLLNGSDHTALQENLVENAASLSKYVPVVLGGLSDFGDLLRANQHNFPVIEGELRFGRYQPILKDVMSARIYLKQLNVQAEEALCVEAERFNAIAVCLNGTDRSDFITHAWKELLKNHAHDSICGCSVDAVHDEMVIRFRHVIDTARYVSAAALEEFALSVSGAVPGSEAAQSHLRIPLVVFNPSPWERNGFTDVSIVPLTEPPLGTRIFGYSVPKRDFTPEDLVIIDDTGESVPFDAGESKVAVMDILLRRKVLFLDTLRFYVRNIPPMGYRLYWAVLKKNSPNIKIPAKKTRQADSKACLDNGLIRVCMNSDGTLCIEDLHSGEISEGLNLFVDEADAGDEYTFSSLPGLSEISAHESKWNISYSQNRLSGETVFMLPQAINALRNGRSEEKVPCRLSLIVELAPNERLVRIRTCFDNRAMDHRLRVCFPLGFQPEESIAETAFGLIHRPIRREPCEGWREAASSNYVERRFVVIENAEKGIVLFNKGLPEYEATLDGKLFMTLLRSVGWLSRDDIPCRPGQVGPELPTPGAQCLGQQVFEYGFYLFSGRSEQIPLFRIAEEFQHPLTAVSYQNKRNSTMSSGSPATAASFCSIDNPRVVLSAFNWEQNALIIRVYNPFGNAEKYNLYIHVPVMEILRVSLDGKEQERLRIEDDGHCFSDTVDAYTIATYRLKLREIS